MSVDSGLHVRPLRRRSIHKDESPRSGLRPSHTLHGSRSHSDYGLVSHVQRLEEQRKLSDYGLLPPVVLPCVPTTSSVRLLSSRSASPKIRRVQSSWKSRFHWGVSAPNMMSSQTSEVETSLLPSSSTGRNDDILVSSGACLPKSKSISFCMSTTRDRAPNTDRRSSRVSVPLFCPMLLSLVLLAS